MWREGLACGVDRTLLCISCGFVFVFGFLLFNLPPPPYFIFQYISFSVLPHTHPCFPTFLFYPTPSPPPLHFSTPPFLPPPVPFLNLPAPPLPDSPTVTNPLVSHPPREGLDGKKTNVTQLCRRIGTLKSLFTTDTQTQKQLPPTTLCQTYSRTTGTPPSRCHTHSPFILFSNQLPTSKTKTANKKTTPPTSLEKEPVGTDRVNMYKGLGLGKGEDRGGRLLSWGWARRGGVNVQGSRIRGGESWWQVDGGGWV